jgi:hypothetical protein
MAVQEFAQAWAADPGPVFLNLMNPVFKDDSIMVRIFQLKLIGSYLAVQTEGER